MGQTPAPEPTARALRILGTSSIYCSPIAALALGGHLVAPKSGAVGPIVGAALGTLISTLMLRSMVLSGKSLIVPQ